MNGSTVYRCYFMEVFNHNIPADSVTDPFPDVTSLFIKVHKVRTVLVLRSRPPRSDQFLVTKVLLFILGRDSHEPPRTNERVQSESCCSSTARKPGARSHLVRLTPIAVYSCDASGVIREYNNRAAELWGVCKPEPRDPMSGSAARSSYTAQTAVLCHTSNVPWGTCCVARYMDA